MITINLLSHSLITIQYFNDQYMLSVLLLNQINLRLLQANILANKNNFFGKLYLNIEIHKHLQLSNKGLLPIMGGSLR